MNALFIPVLAASIILTEPPPLAGPKVETPPAPATIVELNMDGSVRRAEPTPEHAALRLLDLDDDTRRRVEPILLRRGRLLDEFVAGNLDLLVKFNTASASGDRADQLALLVEAARELRPVLEPGPLRRQIENVLPDEPRRKFAALLDEYRDALVREHRRNDPKAPRAGVILSESLQSLGREIERAFARQNSAGEILLRYATDGLGLDIHQQRAVRDAVARFVERGGENADDQAKRDLFLSVMLVLNENQRGKLLERFRGR